MSYYFLNEDLYFPPVQQANRDGVLAIGGDLSIERLLLAYRLGIFPWFSEDEPIIWWSPDPRFVLLPENLKVSNSMKQLLRKDTFRVSYDQNFLEVITNCKQIKRRGQYGTWITPDVIESYYELHKLGYAHSVEVWEGKELVGGLYGVALGSCFFGESMFAKASNASKYGFITLVKDLQKQGFKMIDCQVYTKHLESLGARYMPRQQFINHLDNCLQTPTFKGSWVDLLTE